MKSTKFNSMMLVALGSVLALAPVAWAQDTKSDETKPKAPQKERAARSQADRMKQMAEELKLSDEQKTKLQAIMKEENEKLRALRDDTSLSQEDRRSTVRELRQQLAGKVKPILSAEQFEKWEKLRQNAGPGARARAPRGSGPDTPPGDEPKK